MAKTIDRKELLRLARLGAEARLEALERGAGGDSEEFPRDSERIGHPVYGQ